MAFISAPHNDMVEFPMGMPTPRALGPVQIEFLRCMADHGGQTSHGWTWGAASTHRRILGSLVRRGLVALVFQGAYSHHALTDSGREVLRAL